MHKTDDFIPPSSFLSQFFGVYMGKLIRLACFPYKRKMKITMDRIGGWDLISQLAACLEGGIISPYTQALRVSESGPACLTELLTYFSYLSFHHSDMRMCSRRKSKSIIIRKRKLLLVMDKHFPTGGKVLGWHQNIFIRLSKKPH